MDEMSPSSKPFTMSRPNQSPTSSSLANESRPSCHRLPPRSDRLPMICLFAVLGVLGASIILFRTSTYGVGIGSDETQYLSMAKNFAEGNGFTNFMGRHPPAWPPLFPATLAVGVLFGLDAPDAARFLNATAFGLIVFLSGLYLARRVESRLLALGAAMALLVSPTLLSVSSEALTDGPFLLLVLVFLITLDGHLRSGRRSALVWAAVFASLSVLTRYAGALVVAIGFLMLLAGSNGKGRLKNVVIYALVTTLPISAWMVRNAVVTGSIVGRRRPVDEPVTVIRESMQTLVDVIFHLHWGRSWIVEPLGDGVALILALAAVSLGYAVMFRRRSGEDSFSGPLTKPVVLFGTFFLIYTCGLVLVILKTSISYESPRYYLPSSMAFLFVTALLLDGLLRNPGTQGTSMRMISRVALVAVLLNSILSPMARSVDETIWVMANGSKYTAKRWHDRRTISYLKTHAINDCILSNVPDAIYIHMDFRPEKFGFLSRSKDRTWLMKKTTRLAERGCDDVYIVWFDDEQWRRYPYGRREIETWLDGQVVLDVPDGMIWRVERNGPVSRG